MSKTPEEKLLSLLKHLSDWSVSAYSFYAGAIKSSDTADKNRLLSIAEPAWAGVIDITNDIDELINSDELFAEPATILHLVDSESSSPPNDNSPWGTEHDRLMDKADDQGPMPEDNDEPTPA